MDVVLRGTCSGVEAHPGGGDQGHHKKNITAHPGKDNGGDSGVVDLPDHLQRVIYSAVNVGHLVGGEKVRVNSLLVGSLWWATQA